MRMYAVPGKISTKHNPASDVGIRGCHWQTRLPVRTGQVGFGTAENVDREGER